MNCGTISFKNWYVKLQLMSVS